MSDLKLQTTEEQRAELARLAEAATERPWRRSNGNRLRICEVADFGDAVATVAHRKSDRDKAAANAYLIERACNMATALLADHATLEAECQRLRERAEVAEKAVEIAVMILHKVSGECPYSAGEAGDLERGECHYCSRDGEDCCSNRDACCWKKHVRDQARAALGLPAQAGEGGEK